MIYFVVEEDNYSMVKIGTTVNLKQRLRDLQTGNPRELKIVAVIDGDSTVESLLKYRFKDYCINREWFRLDGELLQFIKPHLFSVVADKLLPTLSEFEELMEECEV